jgi:hypothetical protein
VTRLKDGMTVVNKRLHGVERNHSVLAERIETVQTPSAPAPSEPAEMAAP